jgi:Flp pilus assembly pilin Flp
MKKINMKKFLQDTKGASMVEYALLLFAVLICAAVAIKTIGPQVSKAGTQATSNLAPG